MSEWFLLLPERGFLRFAGDAFWQTGLLASVTWLSARCLGNRPAVRSWLILLGISLCLVTPAMTWLARQRGFGILPSAGSATGTVIESGTPPAVPDEDQRRESDTATPGSRVLSSATVLSAQRHGALPSQSATDSHGVAGRAMWSGLRAGIAAMIALVWGVATTACAIRLGTSCWQVWQISRGAYGCRHPKILAACYEASRRLGLPREPRVRRSRHVSCPTVSAWARVAVVYLPMKLKDGTDWLAVFCHELAHVRRRDGWRRILIELATIAFPWQPLVWLLRREHNRACEEACDDWAVCAGADPIEYAQTLTLWIGRCRGSLAPGFSSGTGAVRHRIERLIGAGGRPQPRVGARWIFSGGLVAALVAVGIPLLQPRGEFQTLPLVAAAVDPPGVRKERTDPSEPDTSSRRAAHLATWGSRRWKHSSRARAVGFDALGRIVISTSEETGHDNTVRFWDVITGEQVAELPHLNHGVALTTDRRELLVGQADGTIRVIDVGTRQIRRSFSASFDWRSMMAISERGGRLAVSGPSNEARKKVTVWNYESGQNVATFSTPGIRSRFAFALSPNGDRLAAAGGDELTIWDVDQQQQIGTIAAPADGGAYRAVAFSPDGQSLVAAAFRGKLQVWSTQTLSLLKSLPAPPQVLSIAFDPLGRVMATVDLKNITLWDWSQHEAIWKVPLARFAVTPNDAGVVFSEDGRKLAVGNFHHLVLLDTATGIPVYPVDPENDPAEEYSSMALHPDANQLVIGTTAGMIKIRDLQSQLVVRTWKAHAEPVRRLCYCADGTMLASAGDDRAITIWEPETGRLIHRLEQSVTHDPYYLGFSPDSQKLVCSSSGQRTNIWNPRTGALIWSLQGDRGGLRGPVAFSPDQRTLYSIDSLYNVSLWDLVDREWKSTLSERSTDVNYLALSPDGNMLAAGFLNRLCVWDVSGPRYLIDRAVSQLTALAFAPDGSLITAVASGQLEFWDARTGIRKRVIDMGKADGTVQQISISPDGGRAYTLNANGTIGVLTL